MCWPPVSPATDRLDRGVELTRGRIASTVELSPTDLVWGQGE
jgi:hypothetical protein